MLAAKNSTVRPTNHKSVIAFLPAGTPSAPDRIGAVFAWGQNGDAGRRRVIKNRRRGIKNSSTTYPTRPTSQANPNSDGRRLAARAGGERGIPIRLRRRPRVRHPPPAGAPMGAVHEASPRFPLRAENGLTGPETGLFGPFENAVQRLDSSKSKHNISRLS